MIRFLQSVLGLVAGYALMVVLITLVQEVWLGGVSFADSSFAELALAGSLTFLAAVFGGAAATWISGSHLAASAMSALVVIETTALVVTRRVTGPLWFDLLAAGALIVGILVGAKLWTRLRTRRAMAA